MILVYIIFTAFIIEFCLKRIFNKDRYSNDETFKLTRFPYTNSINIEKPFEKCIIGASRDCHNLKHSLTVLDDKRDHIVTLHPTENEKEGFILPNYDRYKDFKCTPALGTAVLVVDDFNTLEQGGPSHTELHCRCKYPNLMTNRLTNLDCTIPVGCQPGGKLIVPKDDQDNFKDPVVFGKCECPQKNTTPAKDDMNGPFCRSLTISELDQSEWTKLFKSGEYLKVKDEPDALVSKSFIRSLPDQIKEIPNPCSVDLRSGKPISSDDVQLQFVNNIATCLPMHLDGRYVTIVTDTDYLEGNDGRYPNAVTKATDTPSQLMFMFFTKYGSETIYIGFKYEKSTFSDQPHYIFRHNIETEYFRNLTPGYKNHKAYQIENRLPIIDWSQLEVFYAEDRDEPTSKARLPTRLTACDDVEAGRVHNPFDEAHRPPLCINTDTGRLRNLNAINETIPLYEVDLKNNFIIEVNRMNRDFFTNLPKFQDL